MSAAKDKSSVFKVKSVIIKVDTLKFSIRDSKHDLLYKILRPFATALIKKQIQKAIKDSITTGMEYVDGQLVAPDVHTSFYVRLILLYDYPTYQLPIK
ncbi:hypothetical protein PILCRDRAFT_14876 [Piloderma croceum F 1598]|uniref:HAM1-like C-terminal domain-containing protein n=1 Tax=Piloderma croceum (strain F 1598) TaxID=765440 RepID=A0A0C3F1Q2_PILCF|nr:hypothetical protein PILCRDRAFT_14876 [Piloderma croceum F 1598]